MLYLAIVSLFTTSESGANPSDGFCILWALRHLMCVTERYSKSGTGHRVQTGHAGSAREADLCKGDLRVHISR